MTQTPWGPLGLITYKRTYARNDTGIQENFADTVDRIINGAQNQLKCGFTPAEVDRLRNYMLGLKGLPAGRFLWQLGTKTVDKLGMMSLMNCNFTSINSPIEPFTWAFDSLMLGNGVGFSVQREHVYELPKVRAVSIVRRDSKDADFIIPDSREGWVELLRRVLESHFKTGKGFSYSTVCIRGKGTPIEGFGGQASGPEPLAWGIDRISGTLNARSGKKIRSVDALDIMNIIGYIVVSGNVRRSAQLALGDYDDELFLKAKRWDLGSVPNWRAMSNNTVVCSDISQLPSAFWDSYTVGGEPIGLFNRKLSQTVGRAGETQYSDPMVMGTNPCGEVSLNNWETCCLSDLFLSNIKSLEELKDVSTLLYRINKHSQTLPSHHNRTEKVNRENMRVGVGITGYLEATEEQRTWLSDAYKHLREFDASYSVEKGFSPSVKLTTIKPSGTLSLLAGTTSGCHPGFSQYYIRRIRIASNNPLADTCRSHGYPVEFQKNFDGSLDYETVVVEFPCKHPVGTVLAKDMTAIQQIEVVTRLQREWADNAVSCTVYFKKEELPGIQEYLRKHYKDEIKSISFLLHSEHGFVQAPLEEITEEEYETRMLSALPITDATLQMGDIELSDCLAGHCPIR